MTTNGKKMLPEELDQIRKLVQKGESVATIAAKLCTSASNVRNVINRDEDLGGNLPEHYYRVKEMITGRNGDFEFTAVDPEGAACPRR